MLPGGQEGTGGDVEGVCVFGGRGGLRDCHSALAETVTIKLE